MSNPILNRAFEQEGILEGQTMTVTGSILKSLFLFFTIFFSAAYVWSLGLAGYHDKANILMTIGFGAAFISGLVVMFAKPKITPLLAIIYSVGEGFLLGGVSQMLEAYYHGIVANAIGLTFIVTGTALLLYLTRIIKMTNKLYSIILTSTLSVFVIYLIQFVASLFGRSIPAIFTSSPLGIGFSLLVIIIAALNLFIDFHVIETGAQNRLPKLYEWIGAIGLMFTLVWLYIEILNLLVKLNNRN